MICWIGDDFLDNAAETCPAFIWRFCYVLLEHVFMIFIHERVQILFVFVIYKIVFLLHFASRFASLSFPATSLKESLESVDMLSACFDFVFFVELDFWLAPEGSTELRRPFDFFLSWTSTIYSYIYKLCLVRKY